MCWMCAYEELSELTLWRLPSLDSRDVCRTKRPDEEPDGTVADTW